jgi:hypothetical protein
MMPRKRKTTCDIDNRDTNGSLLFKPDLSPHPGHYTRKESRDILRKISPMKLLTDPMHWVEYHKIYLFNFTRKYAAQIGAPAPDFDLPTIDGNRIRLSGLRGKIVAVMLSAET